MKLTPRHIIIASYVVIGLALAGIALCTIELALGLGRPRTNALCIVAGLFFVVTNVLQIRRWS